MDQRQYRRKTNLLWFLITVAAAYSWWFQQRRTLTGVDTVDGTFSVLLGLFNLAMVEHSMAAAEHIDPRGRLGRHLHRHIPPHESG
jgi:hypothetical protein